MATDNTEEFQYNSEINYDEAIMEQQKAIESEINASQNIISVPEDLSSLVKEYNADDAVYLTKIQHLKSKYSKIRRARGDGNCFYRAYGFAMFEQIIGDAVECQRIKGIAEKTKDFLVSVGYQDLTVSDFLEFFVDLLSQAESGLDAGELLATFNDQPRSDYLIVFLRLIVSAELQREADFYSCFIEDGKSVKEFCNLEVEPMARESDHIHMTALASTLKIPIRIEYMDRSKSSGGTNHHDFPEGAEPRLVFLYRPGHYDILYQSKP